MIKKILLFMLVAGICIGSWNKVYAGSGTTTTGVYYETEIKDPTRIVDYIPFNQFSLSTTWGTTTGHSNEFVSNSAGGSSTTDGWVDARTYKGNKSWEVHLSTLSQGNATLQLVGRLGNTGTGTIIYGTTTTGAYHLITPISESVDWYRVEYSIDTIGTDKFSSRIKIMDGVR